MRGRTVDSIVGVPSAIGPLEGEGMRYGPVVDGYVLPMNAADALASGTHNHVPLVIGTNAEETSRMVAAVETPEQYAAAVRAQYGLTLGNQLLAIYPAADYPSPRYALVRLTTDVIWTCPARSLALAAATHQSEPVYRYYFTWHGPGIGGAIVGATHGIELPFVFREFEAFGYSPTPDDLVLSEATQRYWTRLAGGGDVNGPGDITWPRYDTSDPYLTFGEDITAAAGLRSEQCDAVDALAASL
ncbi:MAG TPA: carboxylesterase family protein, partial [Myxococcota bacterium]|nr:carboxylesterase family protein [Myxococcota bacterium]